MNDELFYLTDASREAKIEHYATMEKEWLTAFKKKRNAKFAETLGMLLFCGAVSMLTSYGTWSVEVKVLSIFLVIICMVGVVIGALDIVNHRWGVKPSAELMGWWDYAEKEYGIEPLELSKKRSVNYVARYV